MAHGSDFSDNKKMLRGMQNASMAEATALLKAARKATRSKSTKIPKTKKEIILALMALVGSKALPSAENFKSIEEMDKTSSKRMRRTQQAKPDQVAKVKKKKLAEIPASHSLTETARQRAKHPSDRHKETAKQKAARIKAGGPTKQQKHSSPGRLNTRRIAKRHEQAMPEGTSIYDVDKQKTKKIPTVKAPKVPTKKRPNVWVDWEQLRRMKHGGKITKRMNGGQVVAAGYDKVK